jgi:hypothetical protein
VYSQEDRRVRPPPTAAVAVFVAAVCVAAVGAGLDLGGLRHGAEAVAMVALLSGRGALRAFCLLMAAAAAVRLGADVMAVPPPAPLDPNGCPAETDATGDYWRAQLRYGQVAETLRFLALTCAFQAARGLPQAPRGRRLSVTVALLIPVVGFGLFPLVPAATPGALTLVAAAALTMLAASRAGGGLLLTGAVLMLLPAVLAVNSLAELHHQLPRPSSGAVFVTCAYADASASPDLTVVPWAVLAALLLTGPALFVRSVSPAA